ncbi:helix-turn-helix domain-containing protein [Pelagovum sp. HNIBRBA483]|uniref:helix-turn-helix domain-containing protein n=1 Tax=Pelagovum sp. HNIBRBA483 TaxID=3233341 RepID=UPI0034A1D060
MSQLRASDALLDPVETLGADIRALRKARGLTLSALAEKLGRSVGWLSQVERDISSPSIDDLREIAGMLDVSISSLFRSNMRGAEKGHVVREGSRRPIGSREVGLVEELLSPDLTDDFEVVHSTFEPSAILSKAVSRPTQELGFIVSGQLTLWIGPTKYELSQGDSFRIKGEAFRWENPHQDQCKVIWVIAPPIY